MIVGMYQSITIFVIIFIFYLMDFTLIYRYDRLLAEPVALGVPGISLC